MIWLLPCAWAQQFNGIGMQVVPSDGDPDDAIGVWRPEGYVDQPVAVQATLHDATRPMRPVRVSGEPFGALYELQGAELALFYGATDQVAVAVSTPVWWHTVGAEHVTDNSRSMGATHVYLPQRWYGDRRYRDPDGFALGVVPYLELPTGRLERFVRYADLSGGFLGMASYRLGPTQLVTNVGADGNGLDGAANREPVAVFRLGLSQRLPKRMAMHAEALAKHSPDGTPVEGLLSLHGRTGPGPFWRVAYARTLNEAQGAADRRVFVGLGYTHGTPAQSYGYETSTRNSRKRTVDSDFDGVPDAWDSCPDEAETTWGREGRDGCPPSEQEPLIFRLPKALPRMAPLPTEPGKPLRAIHVARIPFEEAVWTGDHDEALDAAAAALKQRPWLRKVEVQGHASREADWDQSHIIARRRAEAIVDALVERGVDADRLLPVGYGVACPVSSNPVHNRRVDLMALKPRPKQPVPCHPE